ncbi:hypothetical protein ACFV2D_13070 [Streptomyces capillispiralis]|uniref:hypothetical protein n=1 Tax=Streptomyces capillispiralis TaxID=68182 RepID=UPI00368649C8
MSPSNHGRYYWCIQLDDEKGTEVYANADKANFLPDGTLQLVQVKGAEEETNLAFASGHWRFVYAASVMDGSAVAVHRWPGQIVE